MNKNKKAVLFFSIILSLLLAFVFLPWAYKVRTVKQFQFDTQIAESPLLLMKTYEKAEEALFFIDNSATLAYKETLEEIYTNGFLTGECGEYNGYKLLNTKDKNCYPNFNKTMNKFFVQKLYQYFDLYVEKIPQIKYDFLLAKKGDKINIIAKAQNALRMDVTESKKFNFVLKEIEIESNVNQQQSQPTTTQPEQPQTPQQSIQSSGKCGFVADYAKQYIGCPYSLTYVYILTPQTCWQGGLTCATFVGSVITYTLGSASYPYGHGRDKCSNSAVYQLGVNPSILQAGDIFASEYQKRNGGYTPWGHTGMYVGRGYVVPETYGGPFCFRQYRPDPNGEPIFIHSYGWANMGQPGVCYDTFNHLFVGTQLKLTNFCRPKVCA